MFSSFKYSVLYLPNYETPRKVLFQTRPLQTNCVCPTFASCTHADLARQKNPL